MIDKYAFISYSHHDKIFAVWLQRKLESYRLPVGISNEYVASHHLRPIFRDSTDLNAGVLVDELKNNLASSKYLIVICSPASARSEWVDREIQIFIELRGWSHIIPVTLRSDDPYVCEPDSMRKYRLSHPGEELLTIDLNMHKRQQTYIRIVSRLLGVSFDILWQRHKRILIRKRILWGIGTVFVALSLYYFAWPVTFHIQFQDSAHQLPLPEDAVFTLCGGEYRLMKLDTLATVSSLPGYLKGCQVNIQFRASYYESLNRRQSLSLYPTTQCIIQLKRDDTFAFFAGQVRNDKAEPVPMAEVMVDSTAVFTDSMGMFLIKIPLEQQDVSKSVSISKMGYKSFIREDECPSRNLKYILHKCEE